MKKFAISLILTIFVFCAFYPTIYAAQNVVTNETVEEENESVNETENIVSQENKVEMDSSLIENNTVTDENEATNELETENVAEENLVVQEKIEKKEVKETPETYTGKVYIETPENNQTATLPNSDTLKIEGWAISDDENAVVKLYINDEYIKDIEKRIKRADVNNAYPDYKDTTPKAGFSTTLDISAYKEGTYTVKVAETSADGNEIAKDVKTLKVQYTSYTGKVNIEAPTDSKTVTLPSSNTLKIQGWAVSSDIQATLKIYIDGKYVDDITSRATRSDVLKVYSQYKSTTAKPGFSTSLDISKQTEGTHTIKVEEVSRYGKVITSDSKKIKVQQTKYTGKVYIEAPTNNKVVAIPNTKILKVQGWAVSGDTQATLRIYVDGKYLKDITSRGARGDVLKVYPKYKSGTPKPGFTINLDVSKYTEGTHTIKVSEISRFGKVLASDTKKIKAQTPSYSGKVNIETPANNQTVTLPNSNNLTIKGWAVSNDANAVLKLYVNGKYIKKIDTRQKRGDVLSVYPKYKSATAKPGFSTTLNITNYAEGTYTLKVEEVSRYGKIIATNSHKIKIQTKRYTGKVNIETPTNNQVLKVPSTTTLKIQGWAVSGDTQAKLKLYIDGKFVKNMETRVARTDVLKVYSQYKSTTPKPGFSATLNIGNYAEGNHTVTIQEVSRFGTQIAKDTRTIRIQHPNYTSKMYVEKPTINQRFSSGTIEVSGWAITEVNGNSVHIYVDNNYKTGVGMSVSRGDVLSVYHSKYPNHNAYCGFKAKVNLAGLADGTHTITVYHLSKYGKVIGSSSVQIQISNATTYGIDVSHHQGGINWTAVRNSGVDFAILKIGEYRESKPENEKILRDDYFEKNYAACKAAGIKVGGYFYSYEFNSTEAEHEAIACLSLIRGKSFELPIFLDIEDPIVTNAVAAGKTNKTELTNGVIRFCDILNANGYQSGVYSYKSFFTNYLNMSQLERYNVWLAQWTKTPDYTGRYDIWQYSDSGSIPGISGAVDLNYCFRRY